MTKSCPPYLIIGGVPAKVLKMRFTPEEFEEHDHFLKKSKNMQINNKITLELQSETFKALRFPLAVMVVFIHSFNLLENNLPNWEHITGMDINAAIQILFSKVITSIAVPTFYLISGYFFFYKVTNFDFLTYKRKLEKRVHTLLNPYLLWNVLPILWTILKIIAAFFVKGKPLSNILLYLQGSQGVRMFWDCSVWGFNTTNWLGYPTPPHRSVFIFSVVFERSNGCSFVNTNYILFYKTI